jgi:HD-like signal output (HDOD) protein
MTPIGTILRNAELVSETDVTRALDKQAREGGRTLRNLFAIGAISRNALYRFLASQGLPTLSPLNYRIPNQILDLLPPEFVVQHEMLPVDRMGPMLTVVMVYPWDEAAIREAESLTGLRINAFLCDSDDFSTAYHRYFSRSLDDDSKAYSNKNGGPDTKREERPVRETAYGLNALRTGVSKIDDLPVLAATVNRLSHIECLTMERLVECIAQDAAAAAIVLREANALRKGKANPILRIEEAIRVLGLADARDTVLSAPVIAKTDDRIVQEYIRVLRESVTVASVAQSLAGTCAEELGPGHAPYEAALLANLGRLALIELVRREAANADPRTHAQRFQALVEAITKTNHAETGAQLATAWKLPKLFVESIRQMRTPALARQYRKTAALIHLADSLVRRTNAILETDCEKSLDLLGCSTLAVHRALWPSAPYDTEVKTPELAVMA